MPTSSWPQGVKRMSMEELDNLGIDERNRLYWHGERVVVERQLTLTWWQSFFAVLAALGAFVSGIADLAQLMGWR